MSFDQPDNEQVNSNPLDSTNVKSAMEALQELVNYSNSSKIGGDQIGPPYLRPNDLMPNAQKGILDGFNYKKIEPNSKIENFKAIKKQLEDAQQKVEMLKKMLETSANEARQEAEEVLKILNQEEGKTHAQQLDPGGRVIED